MGTVNNIVGKTFGQLIVLEEDGRTPYGLVLWKCLCSCGNTKTIRGPDLRNGRTKSCGCLRNKVTVARSTTHNLRYHPLYDIWKGITQRTMNTKCISYKNYGAKGVKLCDRWKVLENFVVDMYPSYQDGLSINRIDPCGNYCKENCNWATWSEQGHFKRKKEGCSSEYYGVYLHKKSGKFMARITANKNVEYIGAFLNEVVAATAYDNRSEELYGDRPNGTINIERATDEVNH